MKPFNLKAAKRGEPIVHALEQNAIITFIGVRPDGRIVYEHENGLLISVLEKNLFMAPMKRTVWVNLYRTGDNYACHHNTEEEAEIAAMNMNRIGGKAYPVEIEE